MQAMGHMQRRIAAHIRIPDERQLSSAGASTSGRFTKCHKCAAVRACTHLQHLVTTS